MAQVCIFCTKKPPVHGHSWMNARENGCSSVGFINCRIGQKSVWKGLMKIKLRVASKA